MFSQGPAVAAVTELSSGGLTPMLKVLITHYGISIDASNSVTFLGEDALNRSQ